MLPVAMDEIITPPPIAANASNPLGRRIYQYLFNLVNEVIYINPADL